MTSKDFFNIVNYKSFGKIYKKVYTLFINNIINYKSKSEIKINSVIIEKYFHNKWLKSKKQLTEKTNRRINE
jgi:hypothetical protein